MFTCESSLDRKSWTVVEVRGISRNESLMELRENLKIHYIRLSD